MADETNVVTGGQPTPAPDVSAPPAGQPTASAESARYDEAVGTGAPATTAPQTPQLPEKFRGKSAEEIANAYLEVEREKGRLADEAGRYRGYAEQLWAEKQQYEQAVRQAQYQPPPAPTAPPAEFNWEKPAESVAAVAERLVNERMGNFMGALQQAQVASVRDKAATSWDEGASTITKNQRLFEGIEDEVRNVVYQTYDPIVQRGGDASKYYADPKIWETAAVMIRYKRGEIDRIAGSGTPSRGMSAPTTEVPGGSRPSNQGSTIVLDESARALARDMGIKDGEARDLIELGRKTRRDLR
jgi:hypothetical protein